MNPRLKKFLHYALAAVLLVGAAGTQRTLNRDRETLGLTRVAPLENAPPILAFTTVALGGFRGLIANLLWIRATELQENDKFFEMVQLSDWITKLEPHFVQVWTVQAWNMSYNISVKFKDFEDRWRWVQRGISLLRDEGLKYNPNETLIYRELAWQFQHKMGANLDDANNHYKLEWLRQMTNIFGIGPIDLTPLTAPASEADWAKVTLLTNRYKMNPQFLAEVNERYGPLEWRLPESHAVYWAAVGLQKAAENPTKVKADELIQLRRVIYQSMQLSFQRGKLVFDPFAEKVSFDLEPNLEIIPKVSAAYEQAMIDEPQMRANIETAHRNLLGNAAYFLFANDRLPEALKWYRYLGEKYPDKPLLNFNTNSTPANLTLEEFALGRITEDVSETSRDRVKAVLLGNSVTAYRFLAMGDQQRYQQFRNVSRTLRATYMRKIRGVANEQRIGLPPVEEIEADALRQVLDPERSRWSYPMRAALRAALAMPVEPPPATNRLESGTPPAAN